MSKLRKAVMQAAAGNAGGDSVYVDDVFSTYLYEGNSGNGVETSSYSTGQSGAAHSVQFSSDGLHVFIYDNASAGPNAYFYALDRAFDLTSVSSSTSLTTTTQTGSSTQGGIFGDNGKKIYAGSSTNDAVYQYDLTTAYNASTASYASKSLDVSSQATNPRGLEFKPDGTKLYVTCANTDTIYQYDLSTPWDISTASYSSNSISTGAETNPYNTSFSGDGTVMVICGSVNGLTEFSLSTAWDVSTATATGTTGNPDTYATTTLTYAATFADSGYRLVTYDSGKYISVGDLIVPYDIDSIGDGQVIRNSIDLAGEGGVVVLKGRDAATGEAWITTDTERGTGKYLMWRNTDAESTTADVAVQSFISSGFSLAGSESSTNNSALTYVSYTFRKQPGFFDVVTYTGTGNAGTPQTINHNLDSAPALIIVKKTSVGQNWLVFSKDTSQPHNKYLILNAQVPEQNYDNIWGPNGYLPTTTEFKVDHIANDSGATYVAYLFANNDQRFGTDSDEAIIKSNKVSATGLMTVDLGFEPQWVLIKSVSITNGWILADSMRGLHATGIGPNSLFPNLTSAEGDEDADKINLTSTGFTFNSSRFNGNGDYLYIAIRRPHKPASKFAATDLFHVRSGLNVADEFFSTGFDPDLLIVRKPVNNSQNNFFQPRLTSQRKPDGIFGRMYLMWSNNTTEETATTGRGYFGAKSDGYYIQSATTGSDITLSYAFRRAPEFFDVVAYTGDGTSSHAISHNLGVTPELMIVKRRNASASWYVWESSFAGTNDFIFLNFSNAKTSASTVFPSDPTSSAFTVGSSVGINNSSDTFIAYLFATVPGISKVGTYSGTGSDVNVNCGFTSGARFVLVKRTDSTGDWYVWDSDRGIVAGNDPYMLLNSDVAQVTSTDYIDPLSSGFTITSTAPAALNAFGGTYIFLAIA
jgi:hypothetical protein